MASELFHDLYRKAFRLDCGAIHILNSMAHTLGPGNTSTRAHTVDQLLELGQEFDETLEDIARANRMSVRRFKFRCPHCGNPYCPAAVPVTPLPDDIQEYLMAGGSLADLLED